MNKFIVSIFGGSGSGKSTLAIRLVEIFGDHRAVRIPSDYFLRSYNRPPRTLDYDWDLLEEVLDQEGGTMISIPTYDFQVFRRVSLEGEKRLVMRPLVIFDSMVPYPKSNFTILLTCDDAERQRRIIERDQRWKTDVIRYWDLHQSTLEKTLQTGVVINLELKGENPVEENASRILTIISNLPGASFLIAES